jgi:hypothetical protein
MLTLRWARRATNSRRHHATTTIYRDRSSAGVKPRLLQKQAEGSYRDLDRAARGAAWFVCVLATACATVHSQDMPSPPSSKGSGVEKPAATSIVPQDTIEAALDDAVNRTTATRQQILVTIAEAVTWNDGSLGCPQPGMLYTQALVPGYRIVVSAAGQVLHYHASLHGRPVFCPAARVVAPVGSETSTT